MNTGDISALPTFENRITAYLHVHGSDMAPGEYVVRQARCIRRLARLGYGPETLEAALAYLDRHPELLAGDEWAPAHVEDVSLT